jgi:hypothetical protein
MVVVLTFLAPTAQVSASVGPPDQSAQPQTAYIWADYDWWDGVLYLHLTPGDVDAILLTEGAAIAGMAGTACSYTGPMIGFCAALVGAATYQIQHALEGWDGGCDDLILGLTFGMWGTPIVWVQDCIVTWDGGGGGGSRGFGYAPLLHS